MTVLDYRSGIEDFADGTRGRSGSWGSWGVYLAMSWTWCIGMYLPVILVRDYGVWAWVIFAIPNVVGAAAMGWILKDHDSQSIVVAHGRAIKIFSVVTASFQIYFALWIFEQMGASGAELLALIFALVVLRACRRDLDVQSLAGVVFLASLVTMLFEVMQGALGAPYPVPLKAGTVLDLLSLVPVCFFGFLLCPYLDPTFHHARQQLHTQQARAAFTVGFGFFFVVMILYSLLYAKLFELGSIYSQRAGVIAHWIFQLGLTIGLHWFGIQREGERQPRAKIWTTVGISFVIGVIAFSVTMIGPNGLDGEIIYRCFMGFYGLAFPAYVWLCMIPGKGRRLPTHKQWVVLGAAILVALPMYWLGFVEKRMLWLIPGVAVVLLARLLINRSELGVEPLVQTQPTD
jgi:hypothetical protein